MVVGNVEQERISRLEGTYEQVDRRLDDMNSRLDGMQRAIDGLRGEMNNLRGEMNQAIDGLRGEMNNRYNTLVMLIVASWVTIMAALITALVALFLK